MPSGLFELIPFDATSRHLDAIIALNRRLWPREEPQVRRHANLPGFRGIVALTPAGDVAGSAYGWTVLPGQWWTGCIAPVLGYEQTERYLIGSFTVAELGVAAEQRRRGLGSRLMRAVLADLPHTQVTLSTECDNVPARALYEKLGFTYLVERMRFVQGGEEFVVMHCSLPVADNA